MNNKLFKFPEKFSQEESKTFRGNLILALASLAIFAYIFFQAITAHTWQLWTVAGIFGLLFAANLASLPLIMRGNVFLGIWIPFGFGMLAFIVAPVAISGVGLILFLSSVTVVPLFVSNGMPTSRQRSFHTVFSVIAGVLSLLIDIFIPIDRIALPGLQLLASITIGLLIIVFGIATVRNFSDYSIRTKLQVGFLLVSVIPMLIISYSNNKISVKNLTMQADTALQTAAQSTAGKLDTFILDNLSLVHAVSQVHILKEYMAIQPDQRPGSETENVLYIDLHAFADRDPNITSVALIDINGIDVADTSVTDIGLDKSDRTWFTTPLQNGQSYVSPIEYSVTGNEASIYFSAPVQNDNGQNIGLLRIRYKADALQQIVVQSYTQSGIEGVFGVLFDENHIRLAHSSDPSLISKTPVMLSNDVLKTLQAERRLPVGKTAEELSTNLPGVELGLTNAKIQPIFTADFIANGSGNDEAVVASMNTQPWQLVSVQSQEVFLSSIKLQERNNTMITLLVASLVYFAATFISLQFSMPLIQLSHVVARVSEGDLTAKTFVKSKDEVGALATGFNLMTNKLSELVGTLEERVAMRTRALAASAEVSRRLSTILDEKQLVAEVVGQVKNAFNYYHAHIYLYDEAGKDLLMAGGTGEVGKILLARGHKISGGKGLVSRAAENNISVLVTDTSKDAGWLPNPLLPDTKSEMAVPISVGEQVLGVLDVQHNITDGLTPEDVDLLQSIANQIAIALQNARSYARAEHRAKHEALLSSIAQKVQSTTSVESAMQVAAREVGRALDGISTSVVLRGISETVDHQTAVKE